MSRTQPIFPAGFSHYPSYFDLSQQQALVEAVQEAVRLTPFFRPTMPRTGAPTSVLLSNFGSLGWLSDKEKGYRYEALHPKTGHPWRPIPQALYKLWQAVTDYPAPPEACLINWYQNKSRLGAHIDNDEQATQAPIVSVSLGDPAMFRIGGPQRGGPTQGLKLYSGDVVVMAGHSRHCYHSVSKIFYGQSALIPRGGRVNLTLRRVNLP